MQGLVLLLVWVMLCCLGIFLSLPHTAPDVSDVPGVSSALAGANVEHHVDRAANAPAPLPDESYPLTPAEEAQETDSPPVNASLLTMLLPALVYFGTCVGWLLMTNARRQGVICCSLVDDRSWLAVAPEGPSLIGV